jgi:hypothetical protein
MADDTPTQPRARSAANDIVARLASQRTHFRTERDRLAKEGEQAKAELARITAENTELKTKVDTSYSAKRVQELEGKLRDVNHQKVFERMAKTKGVAEAAVQDLWDLSGYKAEGEQPDEAAIDAVIEEQKVRRPWLFANLVATEQQQQWRENGNPKPPPKPGPASGAGPGAGAPGGLFTEEQLSDPVFVMANYDRIAKAAEERMNRGEI